MVKLSDLLHVSENEEFYIDNSDYRYKIVENKLCYKNGEKWLESLLPLNTVLKSKITNINNIKLNNKEIEILRVIVGMYKNVYDDIRIMKKVCSYTDTKEIYIIAGEKGHTIYLCNFYIENYIEDKILFKNLEDSVEYTLKQLGLE